MHHYLYLINYTCKVRGDFMKQKKVIPNIMKRITQKQINDTIDGRCIFLCYEPKIPKKLLKKISEKK